MAALATIHADGRMFKDKGAALLRVAFEAWLFIRESLIHHAWAGGHPPGWREGSVRIMAIGARHETLIYAVLKGHRELCSNTSVAPIAKVCLCFGQKEFRSRGLVN